MEEGPPVPLHEWGNLSSSFPSSELRTGAVRMTGEIAASAWWPSRNDGAKKVYSVYPVCSVCPVMPLRGGNWELGTGNWELGNWE